MNSSTATASGSSRGRAWSRGVLAGPVCFVTAALVMAGGALWIPKGPASIDNIALPIVLFPAIWAALFFYLMLDRKLGRAWLVAGLLFAGHAALIARHVMTSQAASHVAKEKVGETSPAPATEGAER